MDKNSYYRRITELLPKGTINSWRKWVKKPLLKRNLYSYFALFLLLAGIFLTIAAYILAVKYTAVRQRREVLLDELGKWERIVAVHPNYPDAYFKAAYYAFEVRDLRKALSYVGKSLVLDPEFSAAQKLKKLIESGN